MKKPKFNPHQESFISDVIDQWHGLWKPKITRDPRQPHNLGVAKEALKALLFHVVEEKQETTKAS